MKPYTDIFRKPVKKDEVELAARLIVGTGKASPDFLRRTMKLGFGKSATILRLLEDAQVVSGMVGKPRTVLLTNASSAVNAALRQLKKGSK